MHQKYDTYFASMARLKKGDLTAKEKLAQLNNLSLTLQDWGTNVYPEESFDWWVHYDAYGTLPFAGALIDQPTYVRQELTHWTMLKRWHELNEDLPTIDGLPTIEDFT